VGHVSVIAAPELKTDRLLGEKRVIVTKKNLYKDPNGHQYIVGIMRDITERKQAEEDLRRQRASLVCAQNIARLGIWELDLVSGQLTWNDELYHMYEMDPAAFGCSYKAFLEAIHPDDRERVNEVYSRSVQERIPYEIELRLLFPDGRIKYIGGRGETFYDEEGKPLRSFGTAYDLTEHKRVEEQLTLLSFALNRVHEAAYLIDGEGRFLYVNDEACSSLDYFHDELVGLTVANVDLDHPMALWPEHWNELKTNGSLTFESRHRRKNGQTFAVEISANYIEYEGQGYNLALVRDITERKLMENINLARLRLLQFSSGHSLDELFQETLDEVEALTGSVIGFFHYLEPDEKTIVLKGWSTRTKQQFRHGFAIGMRYDVSVAGVWADSVRVRQTVVHNDYNSLPNRRGTPKGHPPVVRELVVPVMRDGRILAILGVGNKPEDYTCQDIETVSMFADLIWDVAERKRAEESQRESERKLSTLIDNIPDAIARFDANGRYLFVNPAVTRIFGRPWEVFPGKTRRELGLTGDDAHRIRHNAIREVFKRGEVVSAEARWMTTNGERTFDILYVPECDESGQVDSVLGIARDITDRKRAEELLRRQIELETSLAKLAEVSPGAVFNYQVLSNGTARIPYASPRIEELTGFRPSELAGDASIILAKIHSDDFEAFQESIAESARTLSPWQNEFRHRHPVKGWVWIENRSAPEPQADGSIIWYGFLFDITARKRRQAQEEIRLRIFESLAQGNDLAEILKLVVEYVELADPDFIGNIMLADAEGKYLHPVCSSGLPEDYLAAVQKVRIGDGIGSCGTAVWRGETVVAEDLRTHPFWLRHNRPALRAGLLSCWSEPIFGASGAVLGTISIYQRKPGSPAREDMGLVRRACHLAAVAIERKSSLDLLHEREQAFRALVENSPDTIARYDAECRRIYINPAMQKLFGVLEEEILGKTPEELSPLLESPAYVQIVRKVWESGRVMHEELPCHTPTGEMLWWDIRVVPEFGRDGKIASVLAIGRDMTARKCAEKALRESEDRYRSLFEESIDGVFIISVAGKIIDVNMTGVKMFGYDSKEEIQMLDLARVVGVSLEEKERFFKKIIEKGSTENEVNVWKKNGKIMHVRYSMAVAKNSKGRITGYQGVLRDVTEERRLERELFKAKKMEIIGQLAGGVAHEVRNPLNAILAISEALFREKEIAENPEYLPYVRHIRTQVERLSKLMKDLLDLGKPLSPDMIHPVSLVGVVTEVVSLWNMMDKSRTHTLRLTFDVAARSLMVYTDSIRLQQALLNLVENASQHSPAGRVIAMHIGKPDKTTITIQVRDSGKGIAPEKLERVFDPFFTTRTGGTGLGLPLVKHFVENMGGEVRIWSNDPPPGCTAEIILNIAMEGGATL
ncbi:MAG: PAS domain S-box protein, partial [Deltaproteobacteria bacterium]|nr:PAS domain S-box protein [Deltaproteobacteria bacterium]